MANIYQFEEHRPVVHESAFVHPAAVVVGQVRIGKEVYIGPCAVLRGDFGAIVVEDGSNVQESCTLHMFEGGLVHIGKGVTIGHGAVIHGARIGDGALVSMNAVVMDDAEVGPGAVVGALSLVPAGMRIPGGKVAVGSPARVVKAVDPKTAEWMRAGTASYRSLPARMRAGIVAVEPEADE